MEDVRLRRWHWWRELAKVQIYVKELYLYTQWSTRINSSATGNPGQEVVRTPYGTVTWVPSDKRIVAPTLNRRLQVLITTAFPPWDPSTDMQRRYHRGRIPIRIANLLNAQGTPALFQ